MLNMEPLVIEWGARLAGALAILLLGAWLARIIQKIVRRVIHQGHMNESLGTSIGDLTYYILLMFAVLAAIAHVGVQTTAIIAVIAAAALAVGLALQGSLANFASGVLLLFLRPFKEGDEVEIARITGRVEHVAIFTTTLDTPDNKRVIIPNARVTGDTITNFSANQTRRVDLAIRIAYSDDMDRARAALMDLMAQDQRILRNPAPEVVVDALGDSSVQVGVRPWVKTRDYPAVRADLTERIKKRLEDEGFAVPFPQQTVHLYRKDEG